MELSDRLKMLGFQQGQPSPKPLDKDPKQILDPVYPVESVVAGIDQITEFGAAFMTQKQFPYQTSHGAMRMEVELRAKMMAVWGKSPRLLETKKDRLLFLDTETSGLAGGTGTYAFLVGVGWYSETGFTVAQYFMRDPLEEPALLAAISERLAGFDVIVTFNGKSFDIPLLNTRLTLNRFPLPFGEMDHIDLLHLARRLWRNRLASRAMGDLEKDIIGFIRDQDEVPGYLIPQYYFDYLSSGDARPLAGVFYHNVFDIVSLAVLFDYMANVLDSPSDFNLHSLDVVAVARLYEENGRIEDAAELYEQGLSSGLPEEIFFTTIDRFATLRRRQGQFQHAATLWEKSARMGNLSACRELSKLLEHNLKRPSDAIAWAQAGLDVCQKSRLPRYQAQLWHEEFTKRIERLRKKVDYG